MKTQSHQKQIFLLVLSMVLAMMSYWIPLPPGPQIPNPGLPEAATQYAPADLVNFAREPMTKQPFLVMPLPPQNARLDYTAALINDSAQSKNRLLDFQDLANDDGNHLNQSKIMPIKDQDRLLKR